MRLRVFMAACIALYVTACSNHPRPRAEPEPAAATAPGAKQPAVQPSGDPDPTPDELALPEDFAAETAAQITSANFRAELDAIEKELSLEQPPAASGPAQQAP